MTVSQKLYINTAIVSQETAQALIFAATQAARTIGIDISVAVVDSGGALKCFARSDNAPFLTVEAATDKAWTAASYGYPTHVWNQYLADPKLAPLTKISRFLALSGGLPLVVDGKIIGAIGISGGTYTQDQEIAEAAIQQLGFI